MSFDVYLQSFSGRSGDDAFLKAVQPHVTEQDGSFRRLAFVDGEADLYLGDADEPGAMVNHVSGATVWDVLVRAARGADWVLLSQEGQVFLTRPEQASTLPDELAESAVLVQEGGELLSFLG